MAGAALMLAHQVSGKAVRDSLFLSVYPATDLPRMVIGAAAFSLLLVPLWARLMSWAGPRTLVPAGFLLSAAGHVAEWRFVADSAPLVAPITYLHIAGFGAVLLSGFWSVANEAFNPRTAKLTFGRIAGAGTAGGITGGLMAERVAALFPPSEMLLLLAAFHFLCAAVLFWFPPPEGAARSAPQPEAAPPREVFRRSPYLFSLAGLVLIGTAGAAIADYAFKAGAAETFGKGAPLLRFFAIFYTSTQVLTFAVQTLATRPMLERLGISKTIGALPVGLGAASAVTLLFPVFPMFAATRAIEFILRGSLFRSGYEIVYTPIPPADKRAAKTIIDVACDRLGDAIGAGAVQALLWAGPSFLLSRVIGLAVALAVAGAWVAARMDRIYAGMIERRLLSEAAAADLSGFEESMAVSGVLESITLRAARKGEGVTAPAAPPAPPPADRAISVISDLRSGDAETVRCTLRALDRVDLIIAPHVVRLLAWDAVAADARLCLEPRAAALTGLLTDFLVDQDQDFAVRRRIPRILARAGGHRAVDGLLEGLEDSRFEVRYQCSRALDYIKQKNPDTLIPESRIHAAVQRELAVGRFIWEGRRLLDPDDSQDELPAADEPVASRARESWRHLFSLLATIYPREPLRTAFRALHSGDPALYGLAVEYLDSTLPPGMRQKIESFVSPG